LRTVKKLEELGIQPNGNNWVLVGNVVCLNCGYAWLAARPAFVFLLYCPECGLQRAN